MILVTPADAEKDHTEWFSFFSCSVFYHENRKALILIRRDKSITTVFYRDDWSNSIVIFSFLYFLYDTNDTCKRYHKLFILFIFCFLFFYFLLLFYLYFLFLYFFVFLSKFLMILMIHHTPICSHPFVVTYM